MTQRTVPCARPVRLAAGEPPRMEQVVGNGVRTDPVYRRIGLMDVKELDITTPDGIAHAWLYPGGSGAAVLMYADAFGVRPAVHSMAERLAGLGHAVLLPNLFYRAGEFEPFDEKTAFAVPAERGRLMALIQSVSPDRI